MTLCTGCDKVYLYLLEVLAANEVLRNHLLGEDSVDLVMSEFILSSSINEQYTVEYGPQG
jgi:hypothetical protein